MKKMLAILLAALMMLSMLSGLAVAEEHDPISIRISWWGDTVRHEKYNKIMDAFEAEYPWIKVERDYGTWNDYWDKLATQVGGGNAPDVMGMHQQYAADYVARGVTLPLEDYIAAGVIDISNMTEGTLAGCKYDDKIVMLPMGITVTTFLVNKTLCDQVGIEIPAYGTPWTMSQFAQLAKDFRAKAEAAGIDAYFVNDIRDLHRMQDMMLRMEGLDMFTEDGNLNFGVENVAAWYAYWKDIRDAGAMPDPEEVIEDASLTLEQKAFTNGKIAVFNVPVNQLYLYKTAMPDAELVCEMVPTNDAGVSGAYLEGAHWAISSTSDKAHQDAAALMINFLENAEGCWQYMLMDQGVPASSKMAEYIAPLLDESNQIAIDFVGMVSKIVDRGFPYPPAGTTEIKAAFQENQEYTMFGYSSPEDAAKAFYDTALSILEANKK